MDNLNTIRLNKNTTIKSMINAYARSKVTDTEKILFIKIILFKTMLLSCMYEMRQTNHYQKGVKKSGNEFIRELNKNLFEDEYTNLLSTDAPAIEEMEKQMELLGEQIANSTLGCFAVMSATMNLYQKEPDYVTHRLNIIKGDSDEIADLERRENLSERIYKLPMKAVALMEKQIDSLENIYITN